MTITRLLATSFDADGTNNSLPLTECDAVSGGGASLSNTYAKTGTCSLWVHGVQEFAGFNVPSLYQIRGGVHIRGIGGWQGTTDCAVFALRSVLGTLFELRISDNHTSLYFTVGGVAQSNWSHGFPDTGWWHFGFDIKINASTGWVRLYQDGVLVATFDGNTGSQPIAQLRLGYNSGWVGSMYYDDLYFDNTAGESAPSIPPGYRFQAVYASGNGNNSGFTGNDEDQTDNYLLVDDAGANDGETTYVYAIAAGQRDTYLVSDWTIQPGYHVTSVIPWAIARKLGTEDCELKPAIYSNGNQWQGNGVALPTAYHLVMHERKLVDPGTGQIWGQAGINAMEVGFESAGTFS